jgi:2-C-methyl-D-erythritol 2,4-cyclodiphosphate synthase
MRIGIGYDSHRFASGRRLVLAGVEVPHTLGLAGHSDADVVAHAVTDAVLGAAALGDIGQHFPPSDPRWKDADSLELLRRAVELAAAAGYRVGNVDVTVVAEAPRVGPHIPAMREKLGLMLGTGAAGVSIKGKSNEGMGWIGRGEGMAAMAVALLRSDGS